MKEEHDKTPDYIKLRSGHVKQEASLKYEDSIRVKVPYYCSLIDRSIHYNTIIPLPQNIDEVKERFEKLWSQRVFEIIRDDFEKSMTGNALLDKEQIENMLNKDIYPFINKSNNLSIEKIKEKYCQSGQLNESGEYLFLKFNFYESIKPFTETSKVRFGHYSLEAEQVYGKYFLFKSWLEEKLALLDQNEQDETDRKNFNYYLSNKGERVFPKICEYYQGSYQQPRYIAALIWYMKEDGLLNANADFLEDQYKGHFNDTLMESLQLEKSIPRATMKAPVKTLRLDKKNLSSDNKEHYQNSLNGIRESLKNLIE